MDEALRVAGCRLNGEPRERGRMLLAGNERPPLQRLAVLRHGHEPGGELQPLLVLEEEGEGGEHQGRVLLGEPLQASFRLFLVDGCNRALRERPGESVHRGLRLGGATWVARGADEKRGGKDGEHRAFLPYAAAFGLRPLRGKAPRLRQNRATTHPQTAALVARGALRGERSSFPGAGPH